MGQQEIPLSGSTQQSSPRDTLARFISDIANPLFLPPIVFLFIGWQSMATGSLLISQAGVSLSFYTLVPLGITILLLKKGHISSLDAPEQKTRNKLFAYTIISSSTGSLMLFFLLQQTQPFLANVAIVYLLNPFLGFLINLKWKISIHTGSLAMAATIMWCYIIMNGFLSIIASICLSLVMLLLLLAMIWARWRLQIHTITELIGGAVAGVLLTTFELALIL